MLFDPELMKLHRDCLKWVEEYNRTYFRDYTQGGELLRKFLPNAHPSLVIQAPFWCDFALWQCVYETLFFCLSVYWFVHYHPIICRIPFTHKAR